MIEYIHGTEASPDALPVSAACAYALGSSGLEWRRLKTIQPVASKFRSEIFKNKDSLIKETARLFYMHPFRVFTKDEIVSWVEEEFYKLGIETSYWWETLSGTVGRLRALDSKLGFEIFTATQSQLLRPTPTYCAIPQNVLKKAESIRIPHPGLEDVDQFVRPAVEPVLSFYTDRKKQRLYSPLLPACSQLILDLLKSPGMRCSSNELMAGLSTSSSEGASKGALWVTASRARKALGKLNTPFTVENSEGYYFVSFDTRATA